MNKPMFRDLTAEEIECRVSQAKENGVALLLYKDARCDQNILDETVGAMNWQRQHSRENANCTVSLWDADKNQWIGKEDTGTESNTEAAKGLASDSFKRACFNWGIGRELYTAPFIWVKAAECRKLKQNGARWQCSDNFEVDSIEIADKRIVNIAIKNVDTGKICFRWGNGPAPTKTPEKNEKAAEKAKPAEIVCELCGGVIVPYMGTNGKTVSVERHCAAAQKTFGKTICVDCITKLQEQEGIY